MLVTGLPAAEHYSPEALVKTRKLVGCIEAEKSVGITRFSNYFQGLIFPKLKLFNTPEHPR